MCSSSTTGSSSSLAPWVTGWSKSSCRRPRARSSSSSSDGFSASASRHWYSDECLRRCDSPACSNGRLLVLDMAYFSTFMASLSLVQFTLVVSHQKGHREILSRVQSKRPEMLLLDVAHLVSSFSPKVFYEFALGALSVFSDRLLVLDMLVQHDYGVTIPCSHWFALLGISCSAEKVNGYMCDSTRQMVIYCFANVSFECLAAGPASRPARPGQSHTNVVSCGSQAACIWCRSAVVSFR